jgi:hypothetical protein
MVVNYNYDLVPGKSGAWVMYKGKPCIVTVVKYVLNNNFKVRVVGESGLEEYNRKEIYKTKYECERGSHRRLPGFSWVIYKDEVKSCIVKMNDYDHTVDSIVLTKEEEKISYDPLKLFRNKTDCQEKLWETQQKNKLNHDQIFDVGQEVWISELNYPKFGNIMEKRLDGFCYIIDINKPSLRIIKTINIFLTKPECLVYIEDKKKCNIEDEKKRKIEDERKRKEEEEQKCKEEEEKKLKEEEQRHMEEEEKKLKEEAKKRRDLNFIRLREERKRSLNNID